MNERSNAVFLEKLTWIEAEEAFQQHDLVLFGIGARTKEHGPHLPLNNDYILAEYLVSRVASSVPVIVIPTLQYGYYPAFLEYPGSVSLNADTFTSVIVEVCTSLSNYGARRFYALITGISTLAPLRAASEKLEDKGIELRYLNILEFEKTLPPGVCQQEGGTHADECETSMMLYIAPELVQMDKAAKDFDNRPNRSRGLSRDPNTESTYSPTGVWGDPTLADVEKGELIVETLVSYIIGEISD